MNIHWKEILDSDCIQCRRKGFTWARGYCQYCGYEQYDVPVENDLRKAKDLEYLRAQDAYLKARDEAKVKNLNDVEQTLRTNREADENFRIKMRQIQANKE